ncbi:hypothetical protein M427DRAFT_64336, partial [Gonapodya prolifera JEL478]
MDNGGELGVYSFCGRKGPDSWSLVSETGKKAFRPLPRKTFANLAVLSVPVHHSSLQM